MIRRTLFSSTRGTTTNLPDQRRISCQLSPTNYNLAGLLRFGAGLAEQIYEQAEGAGVAFGQLARERQARIDIETFAGAGPDEAAFQIFFSGVVHGEHGVVLRVPLFPEVE